MPTTKAARGRAVSRVHAPAGLPGRKRTYFRLVDSNQVRVHATVFLMPPLPFSDLLRPSPITPLPSNPSFPERKPSSRPFLPSNPRSSTPNPWTLLLSRLLIPYKACDLITTTPPTSIPTFNLIVTDLSPSTLYICLLTNLSRSLLSRPSGRTQPLPSHCHLYRIYFSGILR